MGTLEAQNRQVVERYWEAHFARDWNRMATFFSPDTYRSDSNQHWRGGCPHDELRRGRFRWLQLLIHPEIWIYPGETMRETMLALLDDERDRRLELLRADRIDV